jgi:hypothetical protein
VPDVEAENVGDYSVRVTQQDPTHPRSVESKLASLQINLIGSSSQNVQSFDKFQDAVNSEPLRLGPPIEIPAPGPAPNGKGSAGSSAIVVRGYTGTQIFNTTSNSSQGEIFCGVPGGASRWLSLVAERKGRLIVTTEGSSYHTLLAAFTYPASNPTLLQLLGCAIDDGPNGSSKVNVPVEAGSTNLIGVDGVAGAWGVLKLQFDLCPEAFMVPLKTTSTGARHFMVNVRPGLPVAIQYSSDLIHWSTLLTTNTPTEACEFFDSKADETRRFYRAQICP